VRSLKLCFLPTFMTQCEAFLTQLTHLHLVITLFAYVCLLSLCSSLCLLLHFVIATKNSGAKVSNSLTVDQIKNISILSSFRALSYLPMTQTLVLQSEALNQPLAMVVKVHDPESAQQVCIFVVFYCVLSL